MSRMAVRTRPKGELTTRQAMSDADEDDAAPA